MKVLQNKRKLATMGKFGNYGCAICAIRELNCYMSTFAFFGGSMGMGMSKAVWKRLPALQPLCTASPAIFLVFV